MVEMRWKMLDYIIDDNPEHFVEIKKLQYRQRIFEGYDSDGAPVARGWSEWIDVPTVTDSNS